MIALNARSRRIVTCEARLSRSRQRNAAMTLRDQRAMSLSLLNEPG
jgi:hypothetical protein